MRSIVQPGASVESFLRYAPIDGFSMQNSLFVPSIGEEISRELESNGFLEDLIEQESTMQFIDLHMTTARMLHRTLNRAICEIEGMPNNYLPYFSVRVFEPGEYATTIHRNDPVIGPWTVGITLKGEAPFNVYGQEVLPSHQSQTITLRGDETDPTPHETMTASPGSAWALFPKNNKQTPHSGGMVNSATPRELLILYGMEAGDYS